MAKDKQLEEPEPVAAQQSGPDYKGIVAQAPTIHDILARPFLYEQWLQKLQEAVNG